MNKRIKNLIGQKFGRLTVIEFAGTDAHNNALWRCVCSCNNAETIVKSQYLLSGDTNSCGCIYKETRKTINKTHGVSRTRLYGIWADIKERCLNPNNLGYCHYGGRGITICEDWCNSFENFQQWAQINGYSIVLEIDRINNDAGYSPNNCRWVTKKQNCRNRRNSVNLTINNATKTLVEWCEHFNINYKCAHKRLTLGWDAEKALTTPSNKRGGFNGS